MVAMSTAGEWALTSRLADALGTDIMLKLRPVPVLDRMARVRYDAAIINSEDDTAREWVLPEWSSSLYRPVCGVLWVTPEQPTRGARGVLRRGLIGYGIDPRTVSHVWALPRGQRTADLEAEMAYYRQWTIDAMEQAACRYWVLVGRAAWLWRPDMRLDQVTGKPHVWRDQWVVMPLPDPTRLRGNAESALYYRRLRDFVSVIRDDIGLNAVVDKDACVLVKCNDSVTVLDRDGIPYCRSHAQAGMRTKQKVDNRWIAQMRSQTQRTML